MLGKLVKFLIVTRFSKPLVAFIFVFLAYSVILGTLYSSVETTNSFFNYYLVGILIFLTVFMVFLGGVALMKSDLDYLFTLPLNRRELVVSLYLMQFMATGISFLFAVGYVLPYVSGGLLQKGIMAGNIALLALLVTSLSIISFKLETRQKALLATILGVWAILPILGFNYSFTSVFTGNMTAGTFIVIALNIPFNIYAVRQLRDIEIGFLKTTSRRSGTEFRNPESFAGKSPVEAIYAHHLSELSLTGRFGIGGSVSVRISRIRLYYLLIPAPFLAFIYLYLAFREGNVGPINITLLLGSLYIGIFSSILFAQEVLSHERAWLAFISMPIKVYWRSLAISKIMQTYVIMAPFIVSDMVLMFFGFKSALNALIFMGITVPLSPVVTIYFSSRLSVNQIVDSEIMTGQQNLKQMLSLGPILFLSMMAIVSVVSLVGALVVVGIAVATVAYLVGSSHVSENMVFKLTEKGFV